VRLGGKVAIISGAASGIGACTARRFSEEGAKVIVADILDREGGDVAAELVAAGGQGRFVHLDVRNPAEWEAAIERTTREFGHLDIAVNDAGITGSSDDTFDVAFWDRLIGVNATGVFLGMKYEIPAMRAAGGGAIVNVSSVAGNRGEKHVHLGYTAAKAGVRMMSKSAASQFASDGIRVNTVHPGVMPPMRTSRFWGKDVPAEYVAHVPLGRRGEVAEVANAILFLASDEASYITGSELHVDGGLLAVLSHA
jgi:NAD(P)-dependent dehydrogenase (short-subunit alcohol dehydrogenase family)